MKKKLTDLLENIEQAKEWAETGNPNYLVIQTLNSAIKELKDIILTL